MSLNYKKIALRSICDFSEENPTMSLSEILYSILREGNSGCEKTTDIKKFSDEELYNLICKTIQFESE